MEFWEILLIERGYYHRNVLAYQLLRLNVFASMFCMGGNKEGKTPQELWPLYFDKYKQNDEPSISQDDIDEMLELMNAINNEKAEQ